MVSGHFNLFYEDPYNCKNGGVMEKDFLKPAIRKLRPELGDLISKLEKKAPYAAVTLMSREITTSRTRSRNLRLLSRDAYGFMVPPYSRLMGQGNSKSS